MGFKHDFYDDWQEEFAAEQEAILTNNNLESVKSGVD